MTAARVGLIVTGDAEAEGFAEALLQLWSREDATFVVLENHENSSTRTYSSVTNSGVDIATIRARRAEYDADDQLSEPVVDKLVQGIHDYLFPPRSRREDKFDFVVAIDDLELINRGREQTVLDVVRDAARLLLSTKGEPTRTAFRTRASFHLLDPMLEAYFFDSPASRTAIDRRGGTANATSAARVVAGQPCERFEVDRSDAQYFAAVAASDECPRFRRPKDRKCPWRDTDGQDKALHPKKYLQYLCRASGNERFCTNYAETVHGAAALRVLDWQAVLTAGAPYLQSLVEDLADMIGCSPNITLPSLRATALTALDARRADDDQVLRNL